jgi:hypothetical protein
MTIENKILKELLDGEFKDLHPRPKIKWRKSKHYDLCTGDTMGRCIYDGANVAWVRECVETGEYEPVIYLNMGFEGMQQALREDEEYLRDTLRHECLHLLLKRGDDDPVFRAEMKKRGLDENSVLKTYVDK